MTQHPVIALVQKEDTVRWGMEYVDPMPFVLKHLWYPMFRPMNKPAQYAFMKEVSNHV